MLNNSIAKLKRIQFNSIQFNLIHFFSFTFVSLLHCLFFSVGAHEDAVVFIQSGVVMIFNAAMLFLAVVFACWHGWLW